MSIFSKLFSKPYSSVSVSQAQDLLADGAILVDVRTSQEFNAGHAPIARHIPLDSLDRKITSLGSGSTVVTICKSGMRSAQAARMLSSHGLTVASVKGGMFAWQRSGARVVARNGREGSVV